MRRDDERRSELRMHTQERQPEGLSADEGHVVFDFTGLERPDVCDLALILTARLAAAPGESVWVRALPWQTARVLQAMRLDHLFRHYPVESEQLN
ncbi:MAG: hypothetical protein WD995_08655 [Gemmatimonadota bacterium]